MLDQALRSCADTRQYIEKLAALGLDVSAWKAECDGNEALAQQLKAIHFPDRS